MMPVSRVPWLWSDPPLVPWLKLDWLLLLLLLCEFIILELPTDKPFIKLIADELNALMPLSMFDDPLEPKTFPPLPKMELLEGKESIENVPMGKLLLLLLLLLLLFELLVICRGAGDVGVSDPTCWLPKLENKSRDEKSEKSKKDAEEEDWIDKNILSIE